jgi:hypothetical protein
MHGLRVEPTELRLRADDGLLEPRTPASPASPAQSGYGPVRTETVKDDEPKQPSYDIPISRGASKAATTTRKNG